MVRITLTVAFVAGLVASAVASPIADAGVISVPISRRSSSERTLASLHSEVSRVRSKYAQSVHHFERNTGARHALARASADELVKRAKGSEALVDQQNEQFWSGSLTVGTPPQKLTVDFDTGSSDTFFNPKTYNPTKSSTAFNLRKPFTVKYGDGSTATGNIWKDSFSVAGISAPNQAIGLATTSTLDLASSDGLSGLAFPSVSRFNLDPIHVTLIKQGKLTKPVFSVALFTTGGDITFGGVNSAKHTGEITYTDVDNSGGFWATKGTLTGGVSVNPAIIDTGTTLFIGPPADVKKFWKALGVATITQKGSIYGEYTKAPKVTFTIGGAQYKISAASLSFATDSGKTVGGIIGADIGIDGWIVGDTFLQNVLAVFDQGKTRIGFAPKA